MTVRSPPSASDVDFTVAPGTAAPDESVTVPPIEPTGVCPNTTTHHTSPSNTATFGIDPLKCESLSPNDVSLLNGSRKYNWAGTRGRLIGAGSDPIIFSLTCCPEPAYSNTVLVQ